MITKQYKLKPRKQPESEFLTVLLSLVLLGTSCR